MSEFEVLLVGGNSNNGANSGPFYANSNNAWSNANSNIGARHTIWKDTCNRPPG